MKSVKRFSFHSVFTLRFDLTQTKHSLIECIWKKAAKSNESDVKQSQGHKQTSSKFNNMVTSTVERRMKKTLALSEQVNWVEAIPIYFTGTDQVHGLPDREILIMGLNS